MKYCSLIMLMVLFVCTVSCKSKVSSDLTKVQFIPKPQSVEATGHYFKIENSTVIFYEEGLQNTAAYLEEKLEDITGFNLETKPRTNEQKKGILLLLNKRIVGHESYELKINQEIVFIEASNKAGVFNGIQTLLQTLPVKLGEGDEADIPTGVIVDAPEYSYRGAMLDVSRHFFSVEDVKRFIDYLAIYKMNALHLHLTDDQGWRIEIKSWPNLTTHGASTEVGGGEGGFYTQEQYTDIVSYAADRNIEIIPEIDMPGHTNAALASYAELNADNKVKDLYTGTNVGFSTLAARKSVTYKFVDDVIRELSAITPGRYIHIGGDESEVTEEHDYIYFINKVEDIVNKYGKQMIGWADVANAELSKNTVAQFWQMTPERGLNALKQNVQLIMSPAEHAYLDIKYDSLTHIGLNWAGYTELDDAYNWKPATLVPGIVKENILGVEATLWTETVTNMDELEYLVFPRLPGHAEIGWSADANRNWDEYKVRLGNHKTRFEHLGINYYKSPLVPWTDEIKVVD